MKKKSILLGIILLISSNTIYCQKNKKSLNFLEGHWKAENKEIYEEWNLISSNHLKGESYKVNSGIKLISEYLEIKPSKKSIIYTATVLNQNDGKGVGFKLKIVNKNTYSFENLDHDFPKKIIYKKLNDDEIYVEVVGKEGKGFSYKMKKHVKPKTMPNWYVEDLKGNIGNWVADNSKYKSDNEPYTEYGLEWEWGIGKTAIVGRLYGVIDGKEIGDFWKFRQYWDNVNQKVVYEQFGYSGVIGIGSHKPTDEGLMETIQTFSLPDGRKWVERHLSKMEDKEIISTSFDKDENNNWKQKRSYTWKKQLFKSKNDSDLGVFSISLTVKDIEASNTFYEKLGFKKVDGNIDQKWLILKNGDAKIGLFQGMFPKNTITFNPKDVRKIYKNKVDGKIETQMKVGLDKEKGKASFMITDPDSNPILVDQNN